MANFAKIGMNGKVIAVYSVVNEVLHDSNGIEREDIGVNFLTTLYGWSIWKQTSYNTCAGVHKLDGTPFRKNYAGIGMTYDEDRDAFIEPKPYPSWTLNENTCQWEAPVVKPNDGQYYQWNEENQTWDLIV